MSFSPPAGLSPRQWQTLVGVCDTLIPALPDGTPLERRAASDVGVPALVAEAIFSSGNPDDLRDFRRLLDLLGGNLGAVLAGSWGAFAGRDRLGREALLRAWSESPLPDLRKGFQVLKRLSGFFFMAGLDAQGRNPNWESVGYTGPPERPELPAPLPVAALQNDAVLRFDAVVIGSGAGGGVAAWELTARGLQVLVLESGESVPEGEMGGPELVGMQRMYLDRGLATTGDGAVSILAGATLGGGTTINWTASLPPPEWLLDEWEHVHGVYGIGGAAFRTALSDVLQRLHVGPHTSAFAPTSAAGRLAQGCRALGYKLQTASRNVRGCAADCGSCAYGCPFGAKQSTMRTYLADAAAKGARILCGARVERVRIEAGAVAGVEAAVTGADGRMLRLEVTAPLVVVAAGALGTPGVLLRSGVDNEHVGRHLHLHPTTAVSGRYPAPVYPWQGRLLPAYSDQFAHLQDHWGFLLEVAPVHPGLLASGAAWWGGESYKRTLAQMAHNATVITLVRDRGEGRVYLDRQGRRRIDYKLDPFDQAHLQQGIGAALRVHAAAGAEQVATLHAQAVQAEAPAGAALQPEQVEALVQRSAALGIHANKIGLFSAHQMGTARMGPSSAQAVTQPDGQVYGIKGLYVADASAFPAASGVNPMITIMALAAYVARGARTD